MSQVIYTVSRRGRIPWPQFFSLILHCCDKKKHISFVSVRNEKETKNQGTNKRALRSETWPGCVHKGGCRARRSLGRAHVVGLRGVGGAWES